MHTLISWEYSGGEDIAGLKVNTRKPIYPVQEERYKEEKSKLTDSTNSSMKLWESVGILGR